MKKRLSLLLATLMVISLLPISAFAAANAVYTTLNVDMSPDATPGNERIANVNLTFPTGSPITAGTFRLELDNGAKFKDVTITGKGDFNPGTAKGTVDGNTVYSNTVPAVAATDAADWIELKLEVYALNEGDVNLKIVDDGTGIGNLGPIKIFKVGQSSSEFTVDVKDAETAMSFDGGTLSKFEIKNIPNTTDTITIEADEELDWDVTATGTKAVAINFAGGTTIANPLTKNAKGNILTIDINGAALTGGRESIIVTPVFSNINGRAGEGKVMVDLTAKAGATELKDTRATIGKLVDYSVTMTVVEKDKREIPSVWGGEETTVKVTLKGPKGSFSNRTIDFSVDGAKPFYGTGNGAAPDAWKAVKPGAGGLDMTGTSSDTTVATKVAFKDNEFSLKQKGATKFDQLEEIVFELDVLSLGNKDGVATITASQRGWEVKADLLKSTPKFSAETELNPIKKGEARNTSAVTLKEAKAGLLAKGERLILTFDTRRDYTQITSKDIKIEATNGMKFDTRSSAVKLVDGNDGKKVGISIPITKASSGEPAVITVSGLNVAVDGSATDDVVKLVAKLESRRGDKTTTVASPEYIKVVKEYALESITTVFTIGQTQYTKNGQAMTAASAPYIKNGKTMLPIRAVAEALGLNVQWNGATKTATFSDATKVAAVTIGAEKMFVNGTPVPLAAKAELVNGTTFVELRSLSTAFGVQIDWDAAAKTATVSK